MYTPSFVKIPDGGLKIAKKLFELTWNDPIEKGFSINKNMEVGNLKEQFHIFLRIMKGLS